MRFRQAILKVDRQTFALQPGRSNSFDEIYADFQQQPEAGGERWSVFLHPKQDVTIHRLEIQFDLALPPDARFFANGFQSWSESRLYGLNEAIPRLPFFARRFMGKYGDEHIPDIPRGRGKLHSWTYTFIHRNSDRGYVPPEQRPGVLFAGSLNERTGFTLFLYDRSSGILTVRKDMDGLQLSHSFPALDFWIGEGSEQEVFDRYFGLLEIPKPEGEPVIGWTSWYRHFTDVSEPAVIQNLESFAGFCAENGRSGFFQIDDGWQTAVGDWHSVKPAFPQGMGALSQKIRARGLSPGIWLAPFVAAKDSELARKHPDWLLREKDGRLLSAGWNPMWNGWYHALDFYNNEVRNYLGGVFHTLLDRWGFDLLKLDFLFTVCLAPPPGKTRGQVMYEAMEFLRKLAGPKKILACGVPLGAAFGLADYCRIGGDVHMAWEHQLLGLLRFRERVSTIASLRSTLGRWHLNGRAFHNDPDVFILREERQQLTPVQQYSLLVINVLLGNVLFTSDDLAQYSPEQTAELQAALDWQGSRIIALNDLGGDFYSVEFENRGQRYFASLNLSGHRFSLSATGKAGDMELQPFESIVLKC